MFSSFDHECMALALRLAEKGMNTASPNPRVGCVISKSEQVDAGGWHKFAGGPHAEIEALSAISGNLEGATAYVTLEPCSHHGKTPPCCEALVERRVRRVVVAMEDPNPQVAGKGIAFLREHGVQVDVGLLEPQAAELNPGFVSRMVRGRPWVRVKLAVGIDGRTALSNGISKWITGSAARQDVQRWRARSDCILTGSGTVLADNPSLNVRLGNVDLRQPLRAVIDSRLSTPATAKILLHEGAVKIFSKDKSSIYNEIGDVSIVKSRISSEGKLDLSWVLQHLAESQINEVHVEAGAGLSGALLRENLVDELLVYQAGVVMGGGSRGMFDLPGIQAMDQCPRFAVQDFRRIGDDIRTIFRPLSSE